MIKKKKKKKKKKNNNNNNGQLTKARVFILAHDTHVDYEASSSYLVRFKSYVDFR